MTVDEVLAALSKTPLRVNNLFQTDTGWRANLCDVDKVEEYRAAPSAESSPFEFGNGQTPAEALIEAAKKAGYGWTE